MRKILIISILILFCANTFAQNMMQSQYGTSASGVSSDRFDRNGNPIDTTAVNDASTIPVGLSSWVIDERFVVSLRTDESLCPQGKREL